MVDAWHCANGAFSKMNSDFTSAFSPAHAAAERRIAAQTGQASQPGQAILIMDGVCDRPGRGAMPQLSYGVDRLLTPAVSSVEVLPDWHQREMSRRSHAQITAESESRAILLRLLLAADEDVRAPLRRACAR